MRRERVKGSEGVKKEGGRKIQRENTVPWIDGEKVK